MNVNLFVEQLGPWTGGVGPLHRRLSGAVAKAIQQGFLMPGASLPAERKLAEALALSRTTVVTAYSALRAEGWVESKLGSGTRVAAGRATVERQRALASAVEGTSLLNVLAEKEEDVTDFASGTTGGLTELNELFLLTADAQRAMLAERNYRPLGLPALREAIAAYYQKMGVPTVADQILVTQGAQQAITLISGCYVQRGDTVLVENPTYFGALQILRLKGARLAAVPVGPRHVEMDRLRDRILAHGPRLVYLTPTHHNPTGAVMPETARHETARLAHEFGIPIVEDCTLADIELDGKAPKPVAAYSGNGDVLTIGSLSKLFWSGLRIGWIRGAAGTISRLARVKSAYDLGSPLTSQLIAAQLLPAANEAKEMRRKQLRARRDLLTNLIRQTFPTWKFSVPAGGVCLWVDLDGKDSRRFAQVAARYGAALTPGPMFAVDDAYSEFLRLPFLLDEPAMREGVCRLRSAWDEFCTAAPVEAARAMTIV